ncbi:MAG: transcription repressor NadR [Lachnospiraceae bacterium]|nr:transcription repressor NadR [Lachnospiraceae bacterium]
MEGKERRKHIEELLKAHKTPMSGTGLATMFGVSRQVIVQDIALLRAENKDVISTNKGYLLFTPGEESGKKAVVRVRHSSEDTYDELKTIVELGGRVRDVTVDHDIYGQITVDLIINDSHDVDEFIATMKKSKSKPLKVLTDDIHYHTIYAASEKVLSLIREELKEKGYLAE